MLLTAKFLFTVTVILALVALVLVPAPFKPLLFDQYVPPQYYALAENAKEYDRYTLYRGAATSESRRENLLVWFNGGGFLYSDRRTAYGVLNSLSAALPDFDVLVFDYPVRFGHSVRDAMLAVNRLLAGGGSGGGGETTSAVAVGRYARYYAAGMSAGALLMGTFQKKETDASVAARIRVPAVGIRFEAMVGVCGLYRASFDDSSRLFDAMFRFYIMRGTPAPELYGCYGLPDTPKLVIGATTDYLYAQTYRFVTLEPCESKIYANDLLTHSFPLLNNISEARDAVRRAAAFLRKHDPGREHGGALAAAAAAAEAAV